ncbi:nuclease-related domain-containing protein [Psychrobacillus sp. INOP01]|uniref:nuclease-related domain-containing protein n=1 Tax=Psychrobacillus sp. INOP01 TaxID=2829187 RepID=UPI00351CD499
MLFPQHQLLIIPDLHTRLHSKRHIQIDTLILTKSYMLIIEIKNITGTLRFKKDPNQLVRIIDNIEEKSYACPLTQLDRNCDGIKTLFPSIELPIIQALVFPSQNTIIEDAPKNHHIFFAKQIPLFIQKLNTQPPILTNHQFNRIAKQLTKMNNNFTPDSLCNRMNINPEILKKGVLCKNCNSKLHRKSLQTWHCKTCLTTERNPIPSNIEDLFLLIKQDLSVKDCMHYLEINSRYTIYNSLKKMNVGKSGYKKTTKYNILH